MRIFLAAALSGMFLFPNVGVAQEDGLKADLLACKILEKDKKRLKCFDAVLSGLSDTNEGTLLSVAPELPAANPDDEFGAIDLAKKREKEKKVKSPKIMAAGLVEIARNNSGRYVVILDNGQIWRQLKADTSKLLIPSDASGQEVKVKRGLMGAHSLRFSKGNRSIRVERIK